MIRTFINSRKLRMTYSINNTIYRYRSLPIIGKHIPDSVYGMSTLKYIISILVPLRRILFIFLPQMLYLGIPALLIQKFGIRHSVSPPLLYAHLLTLSSVVGIFFNSGLFNATEDKYYAIMLMRMDAKKFLLSDFIFGEIKRLCGFLIMMLLVLSHYGLPLRIRLLLTAMVIIGKPFGAAFMVIMHKKRYRKAYYNIVAAVIILFPLSVLASLKFNIIMSYTTVSVICSIFILLGISGIIYLSQMKDYKKVCAIFFAMSNIGSQKDEVLREARSRHAGNILKNKKGEIISAEIKDSDKFTGYKYFHRIFVKRHKKILRDKTLKRSAALLVLFIIITAAGIITKQMGYDALTDKVSYIIYILPLTIYIINTGEHLNSIFFINCDSAMLTYSFYRKPETILGLFKERLKTSIIYNIIPGAFIALCICALTFFSTESSKSSLYILITITIMALSVFFSVHRLVLYYLFQPYTDSLEARSGPYSIANTITYMASFMIWQAEKSANLDALDIAVGATAFCLLYIPVSIALVLFKAPSTFKIHK